MQFCNISSDYLEKYRPLRINKGRNGILLPLRPFRFLFSSYEKGTHTQMPRDYDDYVWNFYTKFRFRIRNRPPLG